MTLLLDPPLHLEDALRHRHAQQSLLLLMLRARRLALLPFPHLPVKAEPSQVKANRQVKASQGKSIYFLKPSWGLID